MATSLAEIRAKLLEQENQKGGGRRQGDNALFPFWNAPEKTTSVVRFLPDGDESNDYFWLERQMIRIPFTGVKGQNENKPVNVQVPCTEMWGQECPIHAEIRPWFKDASLEDKARTYWKKRTYIFQGFVVDSAVQDDETPDNPIRRLIINPSIFKIICSAMMDPDFGDNLPTDYDLGTDFRITKTQQGQYADYTTSTWARKERSLNEDERDAIAEHGLFNLNDFLPKKPTEQELNAIFEMFEASVSGELYDPERFADFYRPYGIEMPDSGNNRREETNTEDKVEAKTEDKVEDKVEDNVEAKTESSSGKDAKDILAAIRARKEAS